jgi:hypothetical protein
MLHGQRYKSCSVPAIVAATVMFEPSCICTALMQVPRGNAVLANNHVTKAANEAPDG